MSINCRVSFKNNELEVVDKNGQPSKLYYDALELTGNEDKAFDLWYKAFSQEFTEQVKANRDDVTLDEVLKFVSVNSSFRKSLDISEVREIKDIMDKNSFETLSSFHNTLKDIFRPEGVTELNTRKAYESGLYDLESLSEINLDEIDDLLDKIEGTLLKTDIYVTPSSDTSANFIDTSRRTILGTPEFISQEEIEEEIITKVENTKDSSQISSLINNLPYGSFAERFNSEEPFRNQILKNVGAYTKVNTLFIENGIPTTKNLTHFSNLKRTLGTNNKTVGLAADIEFLKEMSDTVWAENQEEVKDVLRDIAFYQFNDNNIDIFGLDKNSSNKKVILDTLNSLGEMLKNPTNESILNFSDKFSALVPQPTSLASEILPENLEPFAQNIFKVHSNLSESELFRDHGLIKVASNLYHKVDLGDRSNLYEQLYQKAKEEGYPIYLKSEDKQEGLRELEKYVMLQDSPLEKDVKEEHILNKLIFNHPKTQDTNDYSQLSDITTDPEYLVGGFPTDFSDYIVTEKQKDSQLYRSTLSKFRVGESGVYLISPVNSIEGIDFQKELEDYIRLSKDQSMKYLLPAKTSSLSKGVDLRAINDPLSVPTYSRQYSVDNGLLVTETTSSDNIRFYGKTYSKVAEDTKNSVFKQVPVNPNNNFYSINNNFITEEDKSIASQILNDAKFSFVDSVVTKQDFDNSIEKAGIQNKVRFSIFGETAARNLDKLEGTNRRTDNLEKAIGMDQELRDKDEYKGSDGKVSETMIARAIKIATEWEKGIDGIWRFESNDERAKLNFGIKTKADITKVRTLGEVLNYPELFDAYPTIKDVKVFFDTQAGTFEDAYSLYTDTDKEIGLGYKEDTLLKSINDLKVLNKYSAETISALINKEKMFVYGDRLEKLVSEGKISIDDVYPMLDERFSPDKVEEWNKQLLKDDLVEEEINSPGTPYEFIHYRLNKNYFDVASILESQKSEKYISTENLNEKLKSTLLHEIQHIIQKEEGFADGGNPNIALYVMDKDQYKKYEELVEKSKEVSIYVLGQNREATQEEYAIITAPSSMAHAVYKRLAGEVEARNVEDRLIIPWSMRKKLLLQKTEELARVDQIVYKAKDIVLNLKKNLDTKTTTDQVIDKLKESKLADNVKLMTSKEIDAQLGRLGVNNKTRKQIAAYHGSPYFFDKFTTSKMGTGEGAQAFGWGLYFTDLKEVAEHYRAYLSKDKSFELYVGDYYILDLINKYNRMAEKTLDSDKFLEYDIKAVFLEKLNDSYKYELSLKEATKTNPDMYDKLKEWADKNILPKIKNELGELYNVTLFKGKNESDYKLLNWYDTLNKDEIEKINKQLVIEGVVDKEGNPILAYKNESVDDILNNTPKKEPRTLKDFYEVLSNDFAYRKGLIDGQKDASLLLLKAGFDGIKYPANTLSQRFESNLNSNNFNYVIFDENTVTIDEVTQFQKALSEKGIKPIVNGFVYNNDVYLNRDTVTNETPIHEFNHLFTNWMKSNRPSLYNQGINLVKQEVSKEDSDIKNVIDYVKQTQPNLQGESLYEEILTELTGREGAALVESEKKSGIIEWLKNFFKEIGNMLGILDATPAQVANMTVRDFARSSAVQLLKGEDIMSKMNSLRDSISNATTFSSEYTPINDTVDSVAEELRACN